MTHPACNYLVPSKDRALQRAVDGNGREYGYWCCSGKHVWSEPGDAEKCCDPEWHRSLSISYLGGDTSRVVFGRYWARQADGS